MGLIDSLPSLKNIGLIQSLTSIAQNDGGVNQNEIDSAKGLVQLSALLNNYDPKSDEYEFLQGLVVETEQKYSSSMTLPAASGLSDKPSSYYKNSGYNVMDKASIDIGHPNCYIEVSLLTKNVSDPCVYEFTLYTKDGKKLNKDEAGIIDAFLKKYYNISYDELMKRVSYDASSKNFKLNIDKVTGNNNDDLDTEDNGNIKKLVIYDTDDYEAIKIYDKLIKCNDEKELLEILNNIPSPEIYKKIDYMLKDEYPSSDLYSSVENFIYSRVNDSSLTNYSSPTLDETVTNLIENGTIGGDDAIKAQARLAARLIIDGADGSGTNESVVNKGIDMIKSPTDTLDPVKNSENAKRVYDEVERIIKKRKTFYGFGQRFNSLEEYLRDDLSAGEYAYAQMLERLHGAIETKYSPEKIAEILNRFAENPENKEKIAVIQDMLENLQIAIQSSYGYGIENDGIFSNMADGISGIWNNNVFIEHGNKFSILQKDMVTYYNNIERLVHALENNTFETEFKDIFGVEFNRSNVERYTEAKQKYSMLVIAQRMIDSLAEQKDALLKNQDDEAVIGTVINILGITPDKQRDIEIRARQYNISLRSIYEDILTEFIQQLNDSYTKKLGGRKLEDFERDQKRAREKAFGNGPYSNMIQRVDDYNISQAKGAAICEVSAEIIIILASMVVTEGATTPLLATALRRFTTEAVRYGIATGVATFTVQMANKASTYEGNTMEHTRETLIESVVDGCFAALSEQWLKKVLDQRIINLVDKLSDKKIYKLLAKCGSASARNFISETGKSVVLTGDFNNYKSGVKALYACIAAAIFSGKSVFSKYFINKGSRKLGTTATYNEIYKDFQLNTYVNQNPEIKKLVEALSEQEFVDLVEAIITDITSEFENESLE